MLSERDEVAGLQALGAVYRRRVREENTDHPLREQGGPEGRPAGHRQEVCRGRGRGEDGQGAQCYIHGDQLQGRAEHPGLPGPARQGDVQQRGRGGPVLNSLN